MRGTAAAALGAVLVVGVQACSSGNGGDGTTADPEPVTLTRTSPASDDLHVATTVRPTLTFSGALDPSSVSATTIALRCLDPYGPDRVTSAVSYDTASHAITVAPVAPLGTARRCVVEVNGVRDGAGRSIVAALAFRTLANPRVRVVSGNGDAVGQWLEYEADAMGNIVREAEHLSAGLDGQWLTADDYTEYVRETAYDGAGNWTRTVVRKSTGPDGVWGNDDDFILDCAVATFDDHGRPTGSLNYRTGLDLQPFTADDFLGGRDELVYSDTGDVRLKVHYDYPGPDGIWLTGDDLVTWYQAYDYDAVTGRLIRTVSVPGAGPDGAWLTADDVPAEYVAYEYDAAGRLVLSTGINKPGDDLAWFTADDVARNYERTEYDAAGLLARVTRYGLGVDGRAFTEDDVVQGYTERTSAPNGGAIEELTYAPGADGIWFTADDVATRTTSFDANL